MTHLYVHTSMRAPSPLFIEERQDHKKLTFTAKHHRPTKAEQKQE